MKAHKDIAAIEKIVYKLKGECSRVAYVSANQHITSKIIKLYQRGVAFIEEIPVETVLQLSLF